jgi:hypothetical protein
MPQEIEASFLNINIKNIRKKLKSLDAKKIHNLTFYKRYTFDLLNNENGFIRIRQEYKQVTMTLKTYNKNSKYANETEIILKSSLEDAKQFLINMGYKLKSYQESIREKWSLNECHEIAIDIIPGLPTYIELECYDESSIKKIASKLELNFNEAKYGNYSDFYNIYYNIDKDIINKKLESLTFNNINKEMKPYIKNNYDNLKIIQKKQLKLISKLKK